TFQGGMSAPRQAIPAPGSVLAQGPQVPGPQMGPAVHRWDPYPDHRREVTPPPDPPPRHSRLAPHPPPHRVQGGVQGPRSRIQTPAVSQQMSETPAQLKPPSTPPAASRPR